MFVHKPFDRWNKLKKKLNLRQINFHSFFHNGEIWWCAIGINVGVEEDGKNENFERPILIIHKFNKDMLWIVPLTSKPHEGPFYYRIRSANKDAFICLSQLKLISSKRLLRKIRSIRKDEFLEIRKRIRNFI